MREIAGPIADDEEFIRRAEPFRRELRAHCYRMLGSMDDAEDAVQETYLRAWRAYREFEGRSSLRAWLYRIATNACLTALQRRARRLLPSGLGDPEADATVEAEARSKFEWLQPIPDALASDESTNPAAIAAMRESVRLALVASLQHLPPKQRAVLILRDVLNWPAADVAEVMRTTTAAVKSMLQRARARLEELAPTPERVVEPTESEARALLDQYIAAFENSDAAALERLLRDDATLELPPSAIWFAGRGALAHARSGLGAPGDWRMLPTAANGQPAAAAYHRREDGSYGAYAIVVLTTTRTHITRLVVFVDASLFDRFGLPRILPEG